MNLYNLLKCRLLILSCLLFGMFSMSGQVDEDSHSAFNLSESIPFDPEVTTRNLDNGFRYYIRVGKYEINELNKLLTGTKAVVFPYIDMLTEGFVGNASPEDMETMFQLIYLYFTTPRKDSVSFKSYRSRMKGFIRDRDRSPESAYYDTIMVTLADYHYRVRPWSEALLDEVDLDMAYDFYKDRFSDAGDFVFLFVGNFMIDSIKPLIKTYIGGLPSAGRYEEWEDPGIDTPKGVIKKTVCRGIEAKSRVNLVFTGPYQWSGKNNYALRSLTSVLRNELREILREDLSGTYGA